MKLITGWAPSLWNCEVSGASSTPWRLRQQLNHHQGNFRRTREASAANCVRQWLNSGHPFWNGWIHSCSLCWCLRWQGHKELAAALAQTLRPLMSKRDARRKCREIRFTKSWITMYSYLLFSFSLLLFAATGSRREAKRCLNKWSCSSVHFFGPYMPAMSCVILAPVGKRKTGHKLKPKSIDDSN